MLLTSPQRLRLTYVPSHCSGTAELVLRANTGPAPSDVSRKCGGMNWNSYTAMGIGKDALKPAATAVLSKSSSTDFLSHNAKPSNVPQLLPGPYTLSGQHPARCSNENMPQISRDAREGDAEAKPSIPPRPCCAKCGSTTRSSKLSGWLTNDRYGVVTQDLLKQGIDVTQSVEHVK